MIKTKVTNLEINELTEEQYKSAKTSGSLNSNAFYMTPSGENTSVITPINLGGTNATTAANARINLGFEYGENVPTHIPSTGDGAIYFKTNNDEIEALPITEGGTGGITATEALNNLDVGKYIFENCITTYRERYAFNSSTSMADTGFTLNIPAKSLVNLTVCAAYNYSKPVAVMVELSSGPWAEGYVANNNASVTLCAYTEEATTLKVKTKYASAASNYIWVYGYIINFEK